MIHALNVIIISGLSGSGKSSALNAIEDLGYYCIDNLPVSMLTHTIEQFHTTKIDKLAIGLDIRTLNLTEQAIESSIEAIKQLARLEIIFLSTRSDVLMQRYGSTRRKHPLLEQCGSLSAAIDYEDRQLSVIRKHATHILDSSELNIHELGHRLRVAIGTEQKMMVTFLSFGFKHGVPLDTDLLFDVRHLPNPFWNAEIKSLTGQHPSVQEFLSSDSGVRTTKNSIESCLITLLPLYNDTNRNSITIGFGCTGGKHRSVYMAEQFADFFAAQLPQFHYRVLHRDQRHWN